MNQRLPSLLCFSASLRRTRHFDWQRQRSTSQRTPAPLSLVLSMCLASFCPSSAPTTFLPTKRHQSRSQVSMTQLHDWDYEVKPARTMRHGKSGLDPLSPSMSRAGQVKPVERECRNTRADQKSTSIASSPNQTFLANANVVGNPQKLWHCFSNATQIVIGEDWKSNANA